MQFNSSLFSSSSINSCSSSRSIIKFVSFVMIFFCCSLLFYMFYYQNNCISFYLQHYIFLNIYTIIYIFHKSQNLFIRPNVGLRPLKYLLCSGRRAQIPALISLPRPGWALDPGQASPRIFGLENLRGGGLGPGNLGPGRRGRAADPGAAPGLSTLLEPSAAVEPETSNKTKTHIFSNE